MSFLSRVPDQPERRGPAEHRDDQPDEGQQNTKDPADHPHTKLPRSQRASDTPPNKRPVMLALTKRTPGAAVEDTDQVVTSAPTCLAGSCKVFGAAPCGGTEDGSGLVDVQQLLGFGGRA